MALFCTSPWQGFDVMFPHTRERVIVQPHCRCVVVEQHDSIGKYGLHDFLRRFLSTRNVRYDYIIVILKRLEIRADVPDFPIHFPVVEVDEIPLFDLQVVSECLNNDFGTVSVKVIVRQVQYLFS